MDEIEGVVIGAGVVGLAVARALSLRGRDLVIVEAGPSIGGETSSRNNEVIHAGFLQPMSTLKGRLCRFGRDQLYRYCAERGIPHQRVGKLVIATNDADTAVLVQLQRLADENGCTEVVSLSPAAARALEPMLRCQAALHSPASGIIDAHALMLSLLGDAEAAGAVLALETRVVAVTIEGGRFLLRTRDAQERSADIVCRMLVNAAGLGARELMRSLASEKRSALPAVHHAKGNFFGLRGKPPFSRLVAPLRETLEKGGAFTLDLAGHGKFGPDVEWIDDIDYRVDPNRAASFVEAIRRYYPEMAEDRLYPDYAGVRPRLHGPGKPPADWMIRGPADHGVDGLVHLMGIETPGLTSCLAIGDYVAQLLERS